MEMCGYCGLMDVSGWYRLAVVMPMTRSLDLEYGVLDMDVRKKI